jgi:antitoxin VapB
MGRGPDGASCWLTRSEFGSSIFHQWFRGLAYELRPPLNMMYICIYAVFGGFSMSERFTAKLFPNGGSQAIRLPKECRFPGDEVTVIREGGRLIIEPTQPRRWSEKARRILFSGEDGQDFPDRDQPPMPNSGDLENW